ncbi:hypothetical protein HMPREF1316_0944 [Olsenella profusa F0195]|uniref:Uncharacterized protein n=1 Tax=Olsenella profusa F0195 TaxID=1125712 RepID=U2UUW9_9ACTN|nr:hypothetical protein HMPREF1316_0944 [Olsenella profusa F0195]
MQRSEYVHGTFHGLPKSHADSFSWRYSYKDSADAYTEHLHGMCLMQVPLSGIAAIATVQLKLPKLLTVQET